MASLLERPPAGVPVQAIAWISPSDKSSRGKGNSISYEENTVILGKEDDETFDVDHIFGPRSKTRDVLERAMTPLLRAFTEGVSCSVFFVGPSRGGKKTAFHGAPRGGGQGLVSMTLQLAWQLLQRKSTSMNSERPGKKSRMFHTFKLQLSFVEIVDETIQDLLNASKRKLGIVNHPEFGPIVDGATILGPVSEPTELSEIFDRGSGVRQTGLTEHGDVSKFSSAVLALYLTQEVQNSTGGDLRYIYSRFLFVDVAGTDDLAMDPATVRLKQGPTLCKSLFGFASVVDQLSSVSRPDVVPFSSSVLTQLIQEGLGGNSIALALGCIKQVSTNLPAAAACMHILSLMQKVHTYPIVCDERALGLLRSFRLAIYQLSEEVELFRAKSTLESKIEKDRKEHDDRLEEEASKIKDESLFKIHDLEGKLIKEQMAKLKIKDDKESTYEKLVELKRKYDAVMDEKSSLEEELVQSEEERLKVAKALLDLRIENTKLVEKNEGEKFELMNRLMETENSMLSLQVKTDENKKTDVELRQLLMQLKSEKEELLMEFATLKNNFVNINGLHKSTQQRLDDLGAELLTVVNQKKVVSDERDRLEKTVFDLQKSKTDLTEMLREVRGELSQVQEELQTSRQGGEEQQAQRMKAELELQRAMAEFEGKKVELERQMMEFGQKKESELLGMRQEEHQEMRLILDEKHEMAKQHSSAVAKYKHARRKLQAVSQQVEELKAVVEKLKRENEGCRSRTRATEVEYREKLLNLLTEESSTDKDKKEGTRIEHIREALGKSYDDAEKRLIEENASLREQLNLQLRYLRMLQHMYTELRIRYLDTAPDAEEEDPPEELPVLWTDPLSGKEVKFSLLGAFSDVEIALQQELSDAKVKLQQAEKHLKAERETVLREAERCRSRIRVVERDFAELETELQISNRARDRLQEELEERRVDGEAMDPATVKQFQKKLLEQISALSNGGDSLRDELEVVKAENRKLLKKLGSAGAAGGAGNNKHLLQQLMIAEKEAASLRARNKVVEEELKSFQAYMETSSDKFQHQIIGLKKQVHELRQENAALGQSPVRRRYGDEERRRR